MTQRLARRSENRFITTLQALEASATRSARRVESKLHGKAKAVVLTSMSLAECKIIRWESVAALSLIVIGRRIEELCAELGREDGGRQGHREHLG
jgi:hypothetical protein